MIKIPPAFSLMPQQVRMINATEGFRLEVCSGCLWLTRPGDTVDHFLVTGTTIDLHENQVLIQSDCLSWERPASYVLMPLRRPWMSRLSLRYPRWLITPLPYQAQTLLNS
jgi:hypothetical protein